MPPLGQVPRVQGCCLWGGTSRHEERGAAGRWRTSKATAEYCTSVIEGTPSSTYSNWVQFASFLTGKGALRVQDPG